MRLFLSLYIVQGRPTHNEWKQIDLLLSSKLPHGPLILQTIQHFLCGVGILKYVGSPESNAISFFLFIS